MRGLLRLAGLLVVMAPLLGGCGPKTVFSMLFPLRYDVRTTITLDDDGHPVTLTGQAHCQVIDATDSIAMNTEASHVGGGLWTRRPDGSLLVMANPDCPWAIKGPGTGEVVSLSAAELRNRVAAAYVFPNPDDASVVDEVTISGPAARDAALRVVDWRYPAVRGPHPPPLASGFPALKDLRAWNAVNRPGSRGAGVMARLAAGDYVAVHARVWRLALGTDCGQTGDAPLQLDEHNSCQFINDCNSAPSATPRSACGQPAGSLVVSPNADFSRMQARIGDLRPQSSTRFYRADRVQKATGQALGADWRPELCIDDLCAPPGPSLGQTLTYFPRTGLLVEMGTEHTNVDFAESEF